MAAECLQAPCKVNTGDAAHAMGHWLFVIGKMTTQIDGPWRVQAVNLERHDHFRGLTKLIMKAVHISVSSHQSAFARSLNGISL